MARLMFTKKVVTATKDPLVRELRQLLYDRRITEEEFRAKCTRYYLMITKKEKSTTTIVNNLFKVMQADEISFDIFLIVIRAVLDREVSKVLVTLVPSSSV